MSQSDHTRSLPDLLGNLVNDVSTLFRKEVQLAKAEAGEKVEILLSSAQRLAIGIVLAIGAVGVLLAAIVSGLAALLVAWGMEPALANSVSALIVAAGFGAVAWGLIRSAISAMKTEKLSMEKTMHALSRDAAVVTER